MKKANRLIDLIITLILWFYFIFGSMFFFFFFYIPTYFLATDKPTTLQKFNHLHMKIFFSLIRLMVPRTKFVIAEEIAQLRSSVIVCNHLSYLDPILLISLLPRQRTIVKSTFFKVPFFGWLLKNSGYVPSITSEMMGPAMIENLENIKEHLAAGGNLFVFPEGTRSRGGKLAPFNKGVFSIARYCDAPLVLIYIKDTNKLFCPGSFFFDTRNFNEIKLEVIGSWKPGYQSKDFSVSDVTDQARSLFEKKIAANKDFSG